MADFQKLSALSLCRRVAVRCACRPPSPLTTVRACPQLYLPRWSRLVPVSLLRTCSRCSPLAALLRRRPHLRTPPAKRANRHTAKPICTMQHRLAQRRRRHQHRLRRRQQHRRLRHRHSPLLRALCIRCTDAASTLSYLTPSSLSHSRTAVGYWPWAEATATLKYGQWEPTPHTHRTKPAATQHKEGSTGGCSSRPFQDQGKRPCNASCGQERKELRNDCSARGSTDG